MAGLSTSFFATNRRFAHGRPRAVEWRALLRRWHRRLVSFVYILRCADGSYYVGHTSDLSRRIARHNEGKAAVHTAARRPVTLAYSEEFETERQAIARERQLKGWTRAKKEALIAGDLDLLRRL